MKALSESCRKLRDFFCPEEMELGLSWEREGQIGHKVETCNIDAAQKVKSWEIQPLYQEQLRFYGDPGYFDNPGRLAPSMIFTGN